MIRICQEESFHQRQGYEIMLTLCRGTPEQKAMAQDALNRWWWPCLMMFGPPDSQSHALPTRRCAGRSSASPTTRCARNSSMRRCRRASYLGLTFPDPELRFDADTGHWVFGEIDWEEFRRVLAGDGPCNRERLAARRQAHDDGAWVREAALAYAAKQTQPARAEAA